MSSSASTGAIDRPPLPPVEHFWGGGGSPGGRGAERRAALAAVLLVMVSIVMVFAALTIAFMARRGFADDWVSIPKPHILLVNTAILAASSVVLDFSRRSLKAGDREKFNFRWTAATALGFLFLLGQFTAWRELSREGFLVGSNPANSFFYVLTAVHAIHLLGGLGALVYVDVQALRLRLGPAKRTAIDVSALFWHFLDGLWVVLVAVLYIWG
jgi:cytochrome c oxidase subunit 3